MGAADAGFVVDFPTLFVAHDWAQAHTVVPDGFLKGEPMELFPWQSWCLLNGYRVKPSARVGQLAPAFYYRRSQIVLPQKAGKAPYTACRICVEAVGPALFAGWATGGEVWDCRDHGCGCGWLYVYEPGEAMGRPWPTPLIQVTATSEEQTDNVYDALRPMIELGPLAELIPKTGEEFIRLPGGGRIDVVTSNARSRLGQRVTFVPQDETGIWTPQTGMVKVAETQRRGLAGMGGRAEETTNAWDPSEGSVAQRTAEANLPDVFRYHPQAPEGLNYRVAEERQRVHEVVYAGSVHVDLSAIDAEAEELLLTDPGQAERFFGNRIVAGQGRAFDPDLWKARAAAERVPAPGALVTVGVDGARFQDAIAVVAVEVATGFVWPVKIIERPPDADETYEHDFDAVDLEMLALFDAFDVWRVYIDPQLIDPLVERWQGRWGAKRIIPWLTNRYRQIAWAVRNFTDAIGAGDLQHDGDETLTAHVRNARKAPLKTVVDDKGARMHTLAKDGQDSPRKIDGAMAGVIAWEARGDAIADGALEKRARSKRAVFS